jgi:glycosyltransferase involved in cell wall biosynthesis
MMAGKPMLVSSSAPLKRIIDKANAGLVFKADDAKDLSEKILQLADNKSLCAQLGENGIRATTAGGMNWETDQQNLIALYNRVALLLQQ